MPAYRIHSNRGSAFMSQDFKGFLHNEGHSLLQAGQQATILLLMGS